MRELSLVRRIHPIPAFPLLGEGAGKRRAFTRRLLRLGPSLEHQHVP
jgi:hypothetical protein